MCGFSGYFSLPEEPCKTAPGSVLAVVQHYGISKEGKAICIKYPGDYKTKRQHRPKSGFLLPACR